MKALVLGCGEMGQVAIRDLLSHGVFTELAIACPHPAAAEPFPGGLPRYPTHVSLHQLDVLAAYTAARDRLVPRPQPHSSTPRYRQAS